MGVFTGEVYRLRRALAHLMHKDHDLSPNTCDGCKEVAAFLAVAGYRGDMEYPEIH